MHHSKLLDQPQDTSATTLECVLFHVLKHHQKMFSQKSEFTKISAFIMKA